MVPSVIVDLWGGIPHALYQEVLSNTKKDGGA